MESMMVYIILGIIVLFILYSFFNNANTDVKRNPDNRDFRNRGSERPRYDDPDIRGQGSFGQPSNESSQDLDWLRRKNSNTATATRSNSSSSSRVSNDSPNVSGRGGFGRDKD